MNTLKGDDLYIQCGEPNKKITQTNLSTSNMKSKKKSEVILIPLTYSVMIFSANVLLENFV